MKKQNTISLFEFTEMIPDEVTALKWYEDVRWKKAGRHCPHCLSTKTVECEKPQPYRCKSCRKHFSVKTGTVMQSSKVPVRKWLMAMYLMGVSKKGISSLQLARELGIAQEAAWRLGHKIREAWNCDGVLLSGKIEVDETYIGGKEKNKHSDKKLRAGRGGVGKQAIMGMRSREGKVIAFPISSTTAQSFHAQIRKNVEPGSTIYTDCHKGYRGMREYRHESVSHSSGEYVRGQIHTNGIESFWAVLKRGYTGTFHSMSVKHLSRYVDEFSSRHNMRDHNALDFMRITITQMEGRLLPHKILVGGEHGKCS